MSRRTENRVLAAIAGAVLAAASLAAVSNAQDRLSVEHARTGDRSDARWSVMRQEDPDAGGEIAVVRAEDPDAGGEVVEDPDAGGEVASRTSVSDANDRYSNVTVEEERAPCETLSCLLGRLLE